MFLAFTTPVTGCDFTLMITAGQEVKDCDRRAATGLELLTIITNT
ncbi:hypothetical protein [Calothrix sp. CCY 0018]